MLSDLANDTVTLVKLDGRRVPGIKASVQSGLIIIPDAAVSVEEGDTIIRKLRSGADEHFTVIDRGFAEGLYGIEPHYQVKVERIKPSTYPPTQQKPPDTRRVFVVHGRSRWARDSMFQFLRSIGLTPIEWSEAVRLTKNPAPFIGEILDAAFAHAQAVVVLFTGDDEARLREENWDPDTPEYEKQFLPQARPNVLFEAGLAFGSHPKQTVLVEIGALRAFSDIQGRHTVRIDDSTEKRQELASRLALAGCAVNLDGTDWHRVGTFSPPKKNRSRK